MKPSTKILVYFCLILIVYVVSFVCLTFFTFSEEIAHDDGTAENFMIDQTSSVHEGCFLVKFYVEEPVSILKIRLYLMRNSTSNYSKGSVSVYSYNNVGGTTIGYESFDLGEKNLLGAWFDTFNRIICNSVVNGTFYVACYLPEDVVIGVDTAQPDNNSIFYPGSGPWYYNQHMWEPQTDKKFMIRVVTSTTTFSTVGAISFIPTFFASILPFVYSGVSRRHTSKRRSSAMGGYEKNLPKSKSPPTLQSSKKHPANVSQPGKLPSPPRVVSASKKRASRGKLHNEQTEMYEFSDEVSSGAVLLASGQKRCLSCGVINSPNAKYCNNCGSKL